MLDTEIVSEALYPSPYIIDEDNYPLDLEYLTPKTFSELSPDQITVRDDGV